MIHSSYFKKIIVFVFEQRLIIPVLVTMGTKFEIK